jgi:hypothetical protein
LEEGIRLIGPPCTLLAMRAVTGHLPHNLVGVQDFDNDVSADAAAGQRGHCGGDGGDWILLWLVSHSKRFDHALLTGFRSSMLLGVDIWMHGA